MGDETRRQVPDTIAASAQLDIDDDLRSVQSSGGLTSKQVDGALLVAGTRPAGVATFS